MSEDGYVLSGEKVRAVEGGRKRKVLQIAEFSGYLENCIAAELEAAATRGVPRTGAVLQFDHRHLETIPIDHIEGRKIETVHQGRLRRIVHLDARGQERCVDALDSRIQIHKHAGG